MLSHQLMHQLVHARQNELLREAAHRASRRQSKSVVSSLVVWLRPRSSDPDVDLRLDPVIVADVQLSQTR